MISTAKNSFWRAFPKLPNKKNTYTFMVRHFYKEYLLERHMRANFNTTVWVQFSSCESLVKSTIKIKILIRQTRNFVWIFREPNKKIVINFAGGAGFPARIHRVEHFFLVKPENENLTFKRISISTLILALALRESPQY